MEPNTDSTNAHWLYHRCTKACSSMQTPLSGMQLAIQIFHFIQSMRDNGVDDISQVELYEMLKHKCITRNPDISFCYDISERAMDMMHDEQFSEEALWLIDRTSVKNLDGEISEADPIEEVGCDKTTTREDTTFLEGDQSSTFSIQNAGNDATLTECTARDDVKQVNDTCQQSISFDELHCFQLRAKVLGLNIPTFNKLWTYLQAAGWTYVNGKYHIPKVIDGRNNTVTYHAEGMTKKIFKHFNIEHGILDQLAPQAEIQSIEEENDSGEGPEVFDNPNDLITYLDEYCMPDYRATLPEILAKKFSQSSRTKAYKKRNIQLRYDLLEVAYRERVRQSENANGNQSKYGHNHRPCDVCFKGANIHHPRVACRKCGLIVHTHCYGLLDHGKKERNVRIRSEVDEKGYFTCDVCANSLVDHSVNQNIRYKAPQSSGWRVHTHPNAICPLCVKNSIAGGMVQIVSGSDAENNAVEENIRKRKSRRSSELFECWAHLFCINVLPSRADKSEENRINNALAISNEIVRETESMRETTIRCEQCAKREGCLVACKRNCGRFYHNLCLQLVCLDNFIEMNHTCLACQRDGVTCSDSRKTECNHHATSKLGDRHGDSSKVSTRYKSSEEVSQYFGGKKSGKKSSKTAGSTDIIIPSRLEDCIAEVKTLFYQSDVEVEFDKYEAQFQQHFQEWSFTLATRQSILLYGLGSKISILSSFGQYIAQEGDVISLNGYDPNIDMNAFFDCVDKVLCDGTEYQQSLHHSMRDTSNSLTKRAMLIAKRIAVTRHRPMFILIHNIDGAGLRNVFAQEALAVLSTSSNNKNGSPMIRIAASVDNVNAAMVLWSPYVEHKFDWAWKMVHTYKPYIEEVRYIPEEEASKKTKRGKGNQTSSGEGSAALKVLAYLAPRHTELLQALAALQLSNESNPVLYGILRDECIKKMLTSSEMNLRNILKELMDHKIVGSAKDKHGNELVFVVSDIPIQGILNFKLQVNKN